MAGKQLLVCDVDNTLYDWVGYFVLSLYAMIDVAVQITGCDREKLLDDLRVVHQKYGDSEQPFALLETTTVKRLFGNMPKFEVYQALDPAFHAFNSTRQKTLKLHLGVRETLEKLHATEIRLVAHTESRLYAAVDRLRRLELSHHFSRIYCRQRSESLHPNNKRRESWLDGFPTDRIVELSHHQMKPNPEVLLKICADEGVTVEAAAYIGDSIARDILMAKRAGVYAIWAAYGAEHSPPMHGALVRVSHWTPDEVRREQRLNEEARSIEPDYIAASFSDVLTALEVPRAP